MSHNDFAADPQEWLARASVRGIRRVRVLTTTSADDAPEVLSAYRPGMGKSATLRRLIGSRPPMTITFKDRGETR